MNGCDDVVGELGRAVAPWIGEHLDDQLADHERSLRDVALLAVDQCG